MKLTGNKCLCRSCGRYFLSPTGFDLHRRGPMEARYCADPESLGMTKREDGFWITKPMSRKSYLPA